MIPKILEKSIERDQSMSVEEVKTSFHSKLTSDLNNRSFLGKTDDLIQVMVNNVEKEKHKKKGKIESHLKALNTSIEKSIEL